MGHPAHPSEELERALRAYEAALVGDPPGRHVDDPTDYDLVRLRGEVLRRSGGLPSRDWPRPACRHCSGDRVLELSRATADGAEELVPTPCPPCWGTGLTLHLAYRNAERSRGA